MENNNNIKEELKEISTFLMDLENKTPFKVSFSYFDQLSDQIVERIKSGEETHYFYSKEIPYFTPAGYFENLSTAIFEKIKSEQSKTEVFKEIETISPLLNTISKTPVYSVPTGYLQKAIWEKNPPAKEAKLFSLGSSKFLFKYAAAAVIAGLLAIGMFLFIGKQSSDTAANNVKAATEVKKLSEQEIVDFLKTTAPTEVFVSSGNNTSSKDNDIKSSVSKMTDNEIQQFLQENGDQDEM